MKIFKVSYIKILLILCVVLGSLLGVSACSRKAQVVVPKVSPEVLIPKTLAKKHANSAAERHLLTFIQKKLLTKNGLYTSTVSQSGQSDLASGHDMLSESVGMWLDYLNASKQPQAFRRFYAHAKATFDQGPQFSYRYDPTNHRQYSVNATLDDLRIIKALMVYDALNHTDRYQKEATKRFTVLAKNCIGKGQLVNYYDVAQKRAAKSGSLAYFDLQTLHYFESATANGKKDYQQQLRVVQNGYLGDVFPLYHASFNWERKQYSSANLNTSEALEVLLHLAEVGKFKAASKNWLVFQVSRHALKNSYRITGEVADDGQSVANYALAALIFATIGDRSHYQMAMKLVWGEQIKDKQSPIRGAVSNRKVPIAYSFNNLTALNAAQRE
ncbi:hypothetical protein [Lentilactobacillus kisonensis]|nr:hypothetical protein [Lentilactobacillus kisonensis]